MENQEEKKPNPPKAGSHWINGPTVFALDTNCVYNVVPDDGMAYWWQVTGGTVTSGQGTDTVTISWSQPNGVITANVVSDIAILDTTAGGHKPE